MKESERQTVQKKQMNGTPFAPELAKEKQKDTKGTFRRLLNRWFIDGMGAMALGLFSSLIIGLIITQIASIPGLHILGEFASILSADSPVVGAAIGVAIAYGLKVKPLAIFSSAATGAYGYMLGGPVGAFVAALVGAELGNLVAGKTPIDIIVTPIVTIVAGCAAGHLAGPPLNQFMTWLGEVVNTTIVWSPLPMSIAVAVLVGMALTAPISSAALCIMMGINGLAAGAAVAGCCAQMMGFAAMSFRENGWGGFLAQGLGTSMLQFSNIVRKPIIWLPPILSSAIIGPVSTVLFGMTNTPAGAGMGTSGLVGQFGAWAAMSPHVPVSTLLLQIVLVHFILPIVVTTLIAELFRKVGIIKEGDLQLHTLD